MIIRPYDRRNNNDELQKLLLALVLLHVHLIGRESFLMGLRLLQCAGQNPRHPNT